jgi:hypothetical protein
MPPNNNDDNNNNNNNNNIISLAPSTRRDLLRDLLDRLRLRRDFLHPILDHLCRLMSVNKAEV